MDYSMVTFIWGVIVGVILTLIAMGLMFGGSKKAQGTQGETEGARPGPVTQQLSR